MYFACPSCKSKNVAEINSWSGLCFKCGQEFVILQCQNLCTRFSWPGMINRKASFKFFYCEICGKKQSFKSMWIPMGPDTYLAKITQMKSSLHSKDRTTANAMEVLYTKSRIQWNSFDETMDDLFHQYFPDWGLPTDTLHEIQHPKFTSIGHGLWYNSFGDFDGMKIGSVQGHWRTSKLGNTHWVSPHMRKNGSFFDLMNLSIFSYIVFPIYFFYFQHLWGHAGWRGHLLLSLIGALFADATLMLVVFFASCWLIYRVWKLF